MEGSSVIQHCQVGYHMAHGNMKYERRSKGSGRKFRSVLPRVPTSFSSALIFPFPFIFKHLQAIACEQALHLGKSREITREWAGKSFAARSRVLSRLLCSQYKMEGLLARYRNRNTEKMNARCSLWKNSPGKLYTLML